MKGALSKRPLIRIAMVESDPLRLVGFRALFDSEPRFELISVPLPDLDTRQKIDLVLTVRSLRPEPFRRDGYLESDLSTFAHYRDRLRYGRRDHFQGHRFRG